METKIIHREVISLPEQQLQMLRSGWGTEAIDGTVTEAITYISDGCEVTGFFAYPKELAGVAAGLQPFLGGAEGSSLNGGQGSGAVGNRFGGGSFADGGQASGVVGNRFGGGSSPDGGQGSGVVGAAATSADNETNSVTTTSSETKAKTGTGAGTETDAKNTKLPCIIWNRGGTKERGLIDNFTAKGMFGQLASWGFVVFASMYRHAADDDNPDEFGGSELNDILNLMKIAEEIPFADTSRWAMEGWSRGGLMAYLALRKRPDIKVAVISGGIADIAECCNTVPRINEIIQNLVKTEGTGTYEARSAVAFADQLPRNCKYLIIHGTNDTVVPPKQALKISEKFLEFGFFFRMILIEEADHFLKGKKKEVDALRKEWLQKYI